MNMNFRKCRLACFIVGISECLVPSETGFNYGPGFVNRTAAAAQAEPAKDKPSTAADPKSQGDDDVPRAKRTLKITVLGPDKKPIPKAKLHAAIWAKEPAKTNRDYVCDDRGEAVVDLPQQIDILRLWATFDGHVGLFAHWSQKFQADGADIPDEYTFQLEQGTIIGGTVVNEDGKPIPGVGVGIGGWRGGKALYNHKHPNVLDTRIPALADKDGIYEWDWAPSDTVTYFFDKPGYERAMDVSLSAEDEVFVVTLPKGDN